MNGLAAILRSGQVHAIRRDFKIIKNDQCEYGTGKQIFAFHSYSIWINVCKIPCKHDFLVSGDCSHTSDGVLSEDFQIRQNRYGEFTDLLWRI